MTNKQPLVLELDSVPGGRVEVHGFVEPLGTPSAVRPPDGAAGGGDDRPMMRPTGETASTEFHFGTETDTTRSRQDTVTWSGQLPVPGRFRGQGGTDTGEFSGGLDGIGGLGRGNGEVHSHQFRQRVTLKNPAAGQSWRGQVRLRFVLHAPGSGCRPRDPRRLRGAQREVGDDTGHQLPRSAGLRSAGAHLAPRRALRRTQLHGDRALVAPGYRSSHRPRRRRPARTARVPAAPAHRAPGRR
jgi:hypothetical protein